MDDAAVDIDLSVVDVSQLPPQVRELVRWIGLEQTYALLVERGGLPTYVPASPGADTILSEILEPEALERLCRELGGRTLDTPKADKIWRQVRDAAIREARAAGATHWALARQYRLSRRQIQNICNAQPEEPDPTGDLFES